MKVLKKLPVLLLIPVLFLFGCKANVDPGVSAGPEVSISVPKSPQPAEVDRPVFLTDEKLASDSVLLLTGGQELPKVNITSPSGGNNYITTYRFGDDWVNATMSIAGSDFVLGDTNVLLKDRGNSTKWAGDDNPKTPFSVKFDSKLSIFGMPKHKRWVLMANYFDRSLIRTQFAGYLGNNVFNSYWNAQFKPVTVYVMDRYLGIYDWGECNKIAKNRVNVQSLEDYADGKADYTDVNGDGTIDIQDAGFMVEIDTAINRGGKLTKHNYKTNVGTNWDGAERIFFYSAEKCIPMTLKDPDFGDGAQYDETACKAYGKYAKSKIDAFEKMLYSSNFKSEYTKYIDALSFIDWYLLNEFAKNSDANFQKSVPVTYNPATGKLYMGPNWDFDLAFGNFDHSYELGRGGRTTVDNTQGYYIWGGKKDCDENGLYCSVNKTTTVQSWWINRLMESSSFRKAVKARWNDRKIYLKNAINEQIVEYANRLYDSIPQSEAVFHRIGQYSWNGPSGYQTRKTYEEEITYLYKWCMDRYEWMDKNINKL